MARDTSIGSGAPSTSSENSPGSRSENRLDPSDRSDRSSGHLEDSDDDSIEILETNVFSRDHQNDPQSDSSVDDDLLVTSANNINVMRANANRGVSDAFQTTLLDQMHSDQRQRMVEVFDFDTSGSEFDSDYVDQDDDDAQDASSEESDGFNAFMDSMIEVEQAAAIMYSDGESAGEVLDLSQEDGDDDGDDDDDMIGVTRVTSARSSAHPHGANGDNADNSDNGDDEIRVISMQTLSGEQLPFVITETRTHSPQLLHHLHHHHHHHNNQHYHRSQNQNRRHFHNHRHFEHLLRANGHLDGSNVIREILRLNSSYNGTAAGGMGMSAAEGSQLMEAIRRSMQEDAPVYHGVNVKDIKKKPIPKTVRKGFTRSLAADKPCPVCCICETQLGRGCASEEMTPVDRDLSKRMFFLPCGHTYCGSCVADYRSRKRLVKEDKFCAVESCEQPIKGRRGDVFRELFGA